MDCKECDGLLVAYAKGDLSAEDEALVERHLVRCESCRWNVEAARQSLPLVKDATDDEAEVARLASAVLQHALREGASDVHIERYPSPAATEGAEPAPRPELPPELAHLVDALGGREETGGSMTRIRYRIDGVLHDAIRLPGHVHEPLAVRLMVLADLNPFERRVPQHGRIRMSHEGREYDVRTGTLPATRGLRLTLRLFGGAAGTVGLEGLGLSETNRERLLAACGQPTGLLLVSGPAGSGRTTLLYALLMQLNREAVSIVTVEDPVESQIPGVTQMHVNRKMGLTYPAALKAFLRHDPDVVMCGEVADRETAAALVEVGITGHLVLAAIAGTDAADGVARFLDLAPDRLVATKVLLGAAGVRLLRRVCEHCAGEVETGALDLEYLRRGGINEPPATLPQGAGCDHCRKTGYRGRTGIQEVMLMRDVPPGRLPEATVDDMRTAIHPSMLEDAAAKVVAGLTTVDEVQRVLAARAEG